MFTGSISVQRSPTVTPLQERVATGQVQHTLRVEPRSAFLSHFPSKSSENYTPQKTIRAKTRRKTIPHESPLLSSPGVGESSSVKRRRRRIPKHDLQGGCPRERSCSPGLASGLESAAASSPPLDLALRDTALCCRSSGEERRRRRRGQYIFCRLGRMASLTKVKITRIPDRLLRFPLVK